MGQVKYHLDYLMEEARLHQHNFSYQRVNSLQRNATQQTTLRGVQTESG